MKQGKTIDGNIIIWEGNKVDVIDLKNNHMTSITFLSEERAKEYFFRHKVNKKRGAKPYPKRPQATVYYNQLII